MAKLGDICTFYSGTGFPIKYQGANTGRYPFYKVGDIAKNVMQGFTVLSLCDNYIDDDVCLAIKGVIVPENTVVFAKIGEAVKLNRRAITNQACLIDNNVMGIKPNECITDLHYFYHYMCCLKLEEHAEATTVPSIKKTVVEKIDIPLPSLEVQHQIAATLDKVTHLIDLCKQQLETLDLLVKSRFIELFRNYDLSAQCSNWQRIDEIGVVIGGATPKTNIADYWNGEYLWITPAELSDDTGYIFDSVRKITKLGIESCSLQEIPKGTVILTSRAPIGKLAIAGSKMYCNQGFKNIICREKIIPRYLYNLLLYNVNYLNSLGRGATFKEISKKIVESILIPVPSLALQEQFAAFVETTDKSKLAVQKQLETLETLKKSLMQEYFS